MGQLTRKKLGLDKPTLGQLTRKKLGLDKPSLGQLMRKKMQGEEVELEEGLGDKLKAAGKKALEKLGHGDDEAMRKDLQKKAGLPQTGKKPTSENVEEAFKGPEAGSGVGDHPFVENSPLNLAKDLAKKSYKKIKQETMMGKIAGGI